MDRETERIIAENAPGVADAMAAHGLRGQVAQPLRSNTSAMASPGASQPDEFEPVSKAEYEKLERMLRERVERVRDELLREIDEADRLMRESAVQRYWLNRTIALCEGALEATEFKVGGLVPGRPERGGPPG